MRSRSEKVGRLSPLTMSKCVKQKIDLLALPDVTTAFIAATGAACIGCVRVVDEDHGIDGLNSLRHRCRERRGGAWRVTETLAVDDRETKVTPHVPMLERMAQRPECRSREE